MGFMKGTPDVVCRLMKGTKKILVVVVVVVRQCRGEPCTFSISCVTRPFKV